MTYAENSPQLINYIAAKLHMLYGYGYLVERSNQIVAQNLYEKFASQS